VIKNRAFSSDPEICGKMGSAVCRGIQKMGVMAVAKHFPGHGDTKEDSHFALARVDKTVKQLEELEFIPFRRVIRSRVEAIMTAHILNPKLDPDYPATMSAKTIDGILRKDLRFTKLVISDDLEMKAIADHYGPDEAAVKSIAAGCDLLIYRGDTGLPVKQIEAIIKAIENKELPMEQVDKAIGRIQAAKRVYAEQKGPVDVTQVSKHIGLPEHFQLADVITRKELPQGHSEGSFS
jgi:beta-N-acetylhexosaminidase